MVKPTGVVHEALEGGGHPCVALCDARIQGRLKGRQTGRAGGFFWGEASREGAGIEGNIELFRGAWSRQAVPGFAWLVGESVLGGGPGLPWFLSPIAPIRE